MKKVVSSSAFLILGFLIGFYTYKLILNYKISNILNIKKESLVGINTENSVLELIEEVKDFKNNPISFAQDPLKDHKIDTPKARKLINEYIRKNKYSLFPLKCIKKDGTVDLLRGFYLDSGTVNSILKDKSNVGINIYLSKSYEADRTGKSGRIYSFIYMGAKNFPLSTNPSTIPTDIKYKSVLNKDNTVYDFIDPCPDACGDFMKKTKN